MNCPACGDGILYPTIKGMKCRECQIIIPYSRGVDVEKMGSESTSENLPGVTYTSSQRQSSGTISSDGNPMVNFVD